MPAQLGTTTFLALGLGLCAGILTPSSRSSPQPHLAQAEAAPLRPEPPKADERGNHGAWYEQIQARCDQDSILLRVQASRRQQERDLRLLPEERAAIRKVLELERETIRLRGHGPARRFEPILDREQWPELWCPPDHVPRQLPLGAEERRARARAGVLRARLRLAQAKVEHRRRGP
jgi:hypothetical protein